MEKVVWDTIIVPGLRQHLIEKYVPKEPLDPLVYNVTAFYWLMQELVGNWKAGRRLTLDQKAQLLQLLVWNLSRVQQEQAAYDEYMSDTFTEDDGRRRNGFDHPRETDINISQDTTDQIAQLVLACKEFS
jgi:uncharacterized protein YeaC (DUF1315 family)